MSDLRTCECGCGATVARRFVRGHNVKGDGPDYIIDTSTGCWLWQRATRYGYGHKKVGGKDWRAHRWYYEQVNGPVPAGLQLDHLCRVRACVNPDHLEPVTQTENIRRGQTHCKNGHEFTAENIYRTPEGTRQCRECGRERCRARRRAAEKQREES